jgi:hypothetical protein
MMRRPTTWTPSSLVQWGRHAHHGDYIFLIRRLDAQPNLLLETTATMEKARVSDVACCC